MDTEKVLSSKQYEKAKLFATAHLSSMSATASSSDDCESNDNSTLDDAVALTARNDPSELQSVVQIARTKAKRIGNDIVCLVEMAEMQYKNRWSMDYADLAILLACLIYVADPMDAIPDLIPVVGYLEDAAVVAFTVEMLRDNIFQFEAWKDENASDYHQGKEEACCEIGCTIL